MLTLEVIVQSVADARAAADGGADRLEVVREIERGGLTPSLDLVRAVMAEAALPLRVMVRENDGFTVTDDAERRRLRRAAEAFAALGVDGLVLGFVSNGRVDTATTEAVLAGAPAVRATFHRAFDTLADPLAALRTLRGMPQIDRVLTDGGGGDWRTRCERWRAYGTHAGAGLTMLGGGGLDEEMLAAIARAGCLREFHVGRAAREPPEAAAAVSALRVRRLKGSLRLGRS